MTTESSVIAGLISAGVVLLIAGLYIKKILPASGEIKYIKTEIENAASPEEKKYWKNELRKLYKECIFGEFGRKK